MLLLNQVSLHQLSSIKASEKSKKIAFLHTFWDGPRIAPFIIFWGNVLSNPSLYLLNDNTSLTLNQRRLLSAGFTAAKQDIFANVVHPKSLFAVLLVSGL